MPNDSEGKWRREHRAYPRYHVDLKALAVRPDSRPLSFVSPQVYVTIKDISQVAVRWHSKEIFYRGELVGLSLDSGEHGLSLRCAVRVFRTRRISGAYEVVGFFLKVAHPEAVSSPAPAKASAGK